MTSTEPALTDVVDEVTTEELMAHVAEFARWTKHAGTDSELSSLRYVERRLQDYGFSTQLISHPAYISIPVEGTVTWTGGRVDGISHSFARSAEVTGPLVAVGAGRPDDYADVDVRGAVVLVDGVPGPATTREASSRGALAQVHVSPHEFPHEMCLSPVWGSPDDQRLGQLPATPTVSIGAADGERLRTAIAGGTPVKVTVTADVDTGWRDTPILVADLPSADGDPQREPFVLFSGHHDTWHAGVMDNGTGNATMLEVARVVARRRQLWRRGLRLAFWSGHSQGRYSGSAWYADEHWEELEARALVHVNVDSTGGSGNTVVCDTSSSAELAHLADEALQAQSGQRHSGQRMVRAGDQSFWGIGVPAVFANMSEQPASDEPSAWSMVLGTGVRRAGAGTGWWWHTPFDTADKIDADLLVRDTRIYLHAMWRLLTDPVLPVDYAAGAQAFAETLQRLQDTAGDRFDLSLPLRRAAELVRHTTALRERAAAAASDPAGAAAVEETIRALSRVLVPLDYTYGDRFEHDPALTMAPLPALADVARLADLAPDGDEFRFLSSRLVRARNRVAVALRDACALLEAAE